jgi:hypothetical protein
MRNPIFVFSIIIAGVWHAVSSDCSLATPELSLEGFSISVLYQTLTFKDSIFESTRVHKIRAF